MESWVHYLRGDEKGAKYLDALQWEDYQRERWPDAAIDIAPEPQAIRIPISPEDLEYYREVAGAGPDTPAAELGLFLRLETSDGDFQRVPVSGLDGDPANAGSNLYLIAALSSRKDASVSDLAPAYRGRDDTPTSIARATISPLRHKYTAHLQALGQSEEDWIPVEVTFPLEPGPVARSQSADAQPGEAPRVHETTAPLGGDPPKAWVIEKVIDIRVDISADGVFNEQQKGLIAQFRPDAYRIEQVPLSEPASGDAKEPDGVTLTSGVSILVVTCAGEEEEKGVGALLGCTISPDPQIDCSLTATRNRLEGKFDMMWVVRLAAGFGDRSHAV